MKKRDIIFNKYHGKCAYTGKPLPDDWQIDHMIPKCETLQMYHTIKNHNDIRNLLPTLKIVNHYKRGLNIEGFRDYMESFHIRLAKLPKNPKVAKSIKRKAYMFEVAEAFGITIDKPFDGIFHFERVAMIRDKFFHERKFPDNPIFKLPITPEQAFNITGGNKI